MLSLSKWTLINIRSERCFLYFLQFRGKKQLTLFVSSQYLLKPLILQQELFNIQYVIKVSFPTGLKQNKLEVLSRSSGTIGFYIIIVNKKSIYFPLWHQLESFTFLTYLTLKRSLFCPLIPCARKIDSKVNFLHYYSMLSSIPSSWKKLLNFNK